MNDKLQIESPFALDLGLLFLDMNYRMELQTRIQAYQESVVRGAVLKKPGWDDRWKNETKEQRSHRHDVNLDTVAESLDYGDPSEAKKTIYERLKENPVKPADDDGDLFQAVARMEIVRRDPDREKEIFFFKNNQPFNVDTYWEKFKHDNEFTPPFEHIAFLWDTADFGANHFLRTLYLYDETPDHLKDKAWRWRSIESDKDLSPAQQFELDKKKMAVNPNFSSRFSSELKKWMLAFKYWLDEPFHAEPDLDKASPAVDDALSAISPVDIHISAAGVSNEALMKARKELALEVKSKKKEPIGDDDKKDETYMYEMTYWSENHQILFATVEYLAGQLWPHEIFKAGRDYRDEGPDAVRKGDISGEEHMKKARPRIIRWLNDRLRFGFNEWNSSVYYQEDFNALFNLADFCIDEEIRTRACMALDLLFFDIARFNLNGNFGVTAGRNYSDQKMSGWEQSIGDLIEIALGNRGGIFVGPGGGVDGSFASSRGYVLPKVLIAIGQDQPSKMIDRSRVSINFEEAGEYGIGFEKEDDAMFWWAKSAYFIKQLIKRTREIAQHRRLMHSDPFKSVLPATGAVGWGISAGKLLGYAAAGPLAPALIPVLGNPFSQEDKAADVLEVITAGSSLTRGNLYTFKNKGVMLSSVQHYRSGQMSFQGQFCQATIGMCPCVWTTHPSAGGGIDKSVMQATGGVLGALTGGAVGNAIGSGLLGPALGGTVGLLGAAAGAYGGTQVLNKDLTIFPATHDGPNWWTGSVTIPRVIQHEHAAIIAYKPGDFQLTLFGHRTHAWFPKHAFQEVRGPVESLNCNVDSGRWIFGKYKDSYVALYSGQTPQWTTDGDWADKELIAEGKRNIFIMQVGDASLFGSFEKFVDKIQHARIHINGLHWGPADFQCSYDIPGLRRLELHYDLDEDEVRTGGQPFEDAAFPRFENPYLVGKRVLWGQYRYTIRYKGYSLTHDFSSLKNIDTPGAPVKRFVNTMESTPRLIEQIDCMPQRQIANRGTTDNAAFAVAGAVGFTTSTIKLYMAWKGVEEDSGIYWSAWDDKTWSPQEKIEGIGSSHSPALTGYEADNRTTGLFMAWKGVDDDSGIYFSYNPTLASNGWYPQEKIAGIGTSNRPALATFDEGIVMAWKGVEDDSGIYFSKYHQNKWQPRQKVEGIGSSDSPSLVVCRNRLFMFWKGVEGDSNIYFSWLGAGEGETWHPQEKVSYKNITGGSSAAIGSGNRPALTCMDNVIFTAWKGIEDDSAIYISTFENNEWLPQVKIRGIGSSAAPSLAVYLDKIIMAWKGSDEDDHGIYTTSFGKNIPDGSGIFFGWAE